MKKYLLGVFAALAMAGAQATPFVATSDIYNGSGYGSSYSGAAGGFAGYVIDGGFDAFDGFGYVNGAGLSVHRNVQLLSSLNTYRWVDTFTNTGSTSFSGNVRFDGNLGSDSATVQDTQSSFFTVSHESWGGWGAYDPVLAIVNGNNAWAAAHMTTSINDPYDTYTDLIGLNLAAGESLSVAHFAILVRPDNSGTYYVPTASIATATGLANDLVNNVNSSAWWSGLSPYQIASIANFNQAESVPEPTSLALLGLGLFGLAASRRRKTV